jgi:hypothetical protein
VIKFIQEILRLKSRLRKKKRENSSKKFLNRLVRSFSDKRSKKTEQLCFQRKIIFVVQSVHSNNHVVQFGDSHHHPTFRKCYSTRTTLQTAWESSDRTHLRSSQCTDQRFIIGTRIHKFGSNDHSS